MFIIVHYASSTLDISTKHIVFVRIVNQRCLMTAYSEKISFSKMIV